MFLKPLPKCSGCLPYVFLIAFQHVTFVSANYTTFFGDMIFIFGFHKFIFNGFSTFEVNFYAIFFAQVFEGFTKSFIVWYSDGTFACGSVVLVTAFVVSGSTYFCFHSIDGPHWIFAKYQGFLDLFLFFF